LLLEELAFKVQEGESPFLGELVSRFSPLVESLAKRYALKGGSYEDLRQEGYLALIKLIYRYKRGEVRLEGYIKGSLERHVKSYWLKELNWKRGVLLSEDPPFKEDEGEVPFELPLSDEERKLLELYYLWGYNDKHISERLDRSRSWVNLKRRRAIRKLKEELLKAQGGRDGFCGR